MPFVFRVLDFKILIFVHRVLLLHTSSGILLRSWCITFVKKSMFLYSKVSGPLDLSKRFTVTLHPLADRFIPALPHLLWNNSAKLQILREGSSLTFLPLSVGRHVLIKTAEWTGGPGASWIEQKGEMLRLWHNGRCQRGFEPKLSWLRVRRSTADLLQSTLVALETNIAIVVLFVLAVGLFKDWLSSTALCELGK